MIYRYFPSWLIFLPYVFLTFYYLKEHYDEAYAKSAEKHLPMIFSVEEGESPISLAKDAIRKKTGFKKFDILERYFCIRLENAFFYRRMPQTSAEWRDYIEDGVERMKYMYSTVPGRTVYHIFIDRPSIIGLGVGALLGRRDEPVVAYQRRGDSYLPVLDLSSNPGKVRRRRKPEEFKYVKVEIPEKIEKRAAIIAEMTTRSIKEDAKKYIEENLGKDSTTVIIVENRYGGVLEEEDWTEPVSELYSIFQELKEGGVEEFHLLFSMPEAMAFGLGYASAPSTM